MSTTTAQTEELKSDLLSHLGGDLAAINRILRSKLRSPSEFVSDVTEHVSRFQGKQIRPILLLLFEKMIAGESSDKGHTLAAAVEMIHMATLVHDDVIDQADTRRHVATVHQRWNSETSILFGDYLFSKSFHLAASSGDAEACRLIGLATDRTCEGELNQSAARSASNRSELEYFRIIRDKTGQLFGLSSLLGARCGNADLRQQAAARRFGVRLGLAFQIADDLLDVTGDQESTGKDTGNDLQNGRMTLPLLRAFKFATPMEMAHLNCTINDERAVSDIHQLPCVTKGIESAAQTACDLVSRAIGDLKKFAPARERELLEAIARYAVSRNT